MSGTGADRSLRHMALKLVMPQTRELHTGGAITTEDALYFARGSAETSSDPLLPTMQMIAHAMPGLAVVLTSRAPPQDLHAGARAKSLPMQGSRDRAAEGNLT
jgi:hypothetical protein